MRMAAPAVSEAKKVMMATTVTRARPRSMLQAPAPYRGCRGAETARYVTSPVPIADIPRRHLHPPDRAGEKTLCAPQS